jgi:hypothetical protein
MPTFHGSLSLADDPASTVRADIQVDEERLLIEAAGDSLGDWPLAEIVISPTPGGFRVRADGEDLMLTTVDDHGFAAAVGVDPPEDGDAYFENAVVEKRSSGAFGRLRSKSAAGWVADETLRDEVAYALLAASVLLVLGAALPWGETRLVDGDGFPWGRALTVLAGLTAGFATFTAWRRGQRVAGTAVAAGAGFIALVVLYFYARAAGIGFGFVLAMLAIFPLGAAAAIGLTKLGIPPSRR